MTISRLRYRFGSALFACLLVACVSGVRAQTEPKRDTASIAEQPTQADTRSLLPMPSPDLARMEPPIRQQIREVQSRVKASADLHSKELGQAYGQLGQVYQAYGLQDAAI